MKEDGGFLIAKQTKQEFNKEFFSLPKNQLKVISDTSSEILSVVDRHAHTTISKVLLKEVRKIFFKKTASFSKNEHAMLKRSLVAKLALSLPAIVKKMKLPESVLVLYPDAFERFTDKLINTYEDKNNSPDLIPHISFVLGLSIPCGAQVVERISKITFKGVIYSTLRFRDFYPFIRYIKAKGYGPWFRIHTDVSYLNDFNEEGWDNCYLRVADLLRCNKDIRGMVGTSWFYDPQLQKISPHLTYLRQLPIERGAFLLRHRAGPQDIEFAIKKSKTRRRLYQEQKYRPNIYSVVWPRKDLIYWAEKAKQKEY